MISWRVTGTGGWAERPPVASRLGQNVTDLSEHVYMLAETTDV